MARCFSRRRLLVWRLPFLLIAAPRTMAAQPSAKTWRIGWLGDGTRLTREAHTLAPFRDGLRELGYIEGKNIAIDVRWSEGSQQQLLRDAADFVRLRVDVIVTHGGFAGNAAKQATSTIPIVVATAADFLAAGLVKSLARPGGNLTGTNDQAGDVIVKVVEVLAEIVTGLRRVALLWDGANPALKMMTEKLDVQARQRNITLIPIPVPRLEALENSIGAAMNGHAQAIVVALGGWTLSHRARIVRLSGARNLPVASVSRLFAEAGALASYGPDLLAVYRHAATFVDKIFRGTPPGEIPVEQPTKYELVINMKTAKALALAIPPSLLLRADHIIE